MSSQYAELRSTNGWDQLASLEHPINATGFASWIRYCTDVAQRRSTNLCTMFGRLLGWYTIYTLLGFLLPNGILPGATFTLICVQVLRSSILAALPARHSSSVHEPNFAAWYKEWNYGTFAPRHFQQRRHLYRGRPSHWASAHILV